jgi:hypothetical protein
MIYFFRATCRNADGTRCDVNGFVDDIPEGLDAAGLSDFLRGETAAIANANQPHDVVISDFYATGYRPY